MPFRFTGAARIKERLNDTVTNLPTTKFYRLSDGQLISEYGGGNKTVASRKDRIIYSTGGMHKHANLCLHWKTEAESIPVANTSLWYTAANPTGIRYQFDSCNLDLIPLANDAFGTTLGLNLEDKELATNAILHITNSWDALKPDLTEVSVPNFLLDLGQIKSLWKLWDMRRSLLPNLANLNLNLQYGWRPTIGDVSNMIGSISNLQKKLKDWNDSLGQLRRKRKTVLDESKGGSGTFYYANGTIKVDWSGYVKRKVTCHIAYRPLPIQALSGFERGLRGALDSLGFELNPGIIWDAIPFSFVVDWFVNVGKVANSFKIDTLELPFALVDSYVQYKESFSVDMRVTNVANVDHLDIPLTGGTYRRSFFHRYSCVPDFFELLKRGWKVPKMNQAILALSLWIGGGNTRR